MIVRFLATRTGGKQEEVGRVIYDGTEVKVTGKMDKETVLRNVFGSEVPQKHIAILAAMHECPRRFDGLYLRAEIVSDNT